MAIDQRTSWKRPAGTFHLPHVLGPLHFIWWMEAQYKPSTHQEFRYLNFYLTKWVRKNSDFSKIIKATRSAQVAKLPQRHPLQYLFQWRGWKSTLSHSFTTFSEKELFSRRFLWWIFWFQGCIGVSKVCGRSFISLRRKLAICEETLCSPLFHSLSYLPLVDQALLIPPQDGAPQLLIFVRFCWYHLEQRF